MGVVHVQCAYVVYHLINKIIIIIIIGWNIFVLVLSTHNTREQVKCT